jgi:CRP-like cAMP-binding protein
MASLQNFSWIDSDKREALARKLAIVRLAKNERTFVRDGHANQLYLVLSGFLQLGGSDSQLAGVAGPGDVFSFSDQTFRDSHVFYYRALCTSQIGTMSLEHFLESAFGVLPQNTGPLLEFAFRRWWGGAFLGMFHFSGLSVHHRLSQVLREIGDKIGVRDARGTILDVSITHDILAVLIGASRPKVTAALQELVRTGAVIRERRRMILVDQRHPTYQSRLRRQLRHTENKLLDED